MESVLLYLLGILIVVVGLAVSIGLHEIGHLVPAKRFGVRVGQYMIGFGPTVVSKRIGETEYGLKWIPLGGYISMAGMFPPTKPGGEARDASTGFFDTLVQEARDTSAESIEHDEGHRAFYQLATWKRIVIMLGGPLMNLVLGFVLYAIVLCGFGTAVPSTTVASVSECVIPASVETTECGDYPAAPANAAGVEPGDVIVAIAGEPVHSWAAVQGKIRGLAGRATVFTVERNGARVDLAITPLAAERAVLNDRDQVVKDANGQIVTQTVGFVGIGPQYRIEQQPLEAVPAAAGDNVVRVGEMILNLPQRLVDVAVAAFGPGERDPNGPVSVVGVGRMAGEIAALDQVPVAERASAMLGVLASLNIALFVFNLIPLMPLDGGHILGAVLDALRRGWARVRGKPAPRPIDTAKWVPVTMAVTTVLAVMSALLIYADIVKPIALFGP